MIEQRARISFCFVRSPPFVSVAKNNISPKLFSNFSPGGTLREDTPVQRPRESQQAMPDRLVPERHGIVAAVGMDDAVP